jgi:hypothetical protein
VFVDEAGVTGPGEDPTTVTSICTVLLLGAAAKPDPAIDKLTPPWYEPRTGVRVLTTSGVVILAVLLPPGIAA